jgi:hypothetical protein
MRARRDSREQLHDGRDDWNGGRAERRPLRLCYSGNSQDLRQRRVAAHDRAVALPIIAQYCATAIATTIAANPIVTPKRCPKNLCCRSLSSSIGAPKSSSTRSLLVRKKAPAQKTRFGWCRGSKMPLPSKPLCWQNRSDAYPPKLGGKVRAAEVAATLGTSSVKQCRCQLVFSRSIGAPENNKRSPPRRPLLSRREFHAITVHPTDSATSKGRRAFSISCYG